MGKELTKHINFRYKLALLVFVSVAVFLAIRFFNTTDPSQFAPLGATPLTYFNDPLDILYVEDNLESLDQKDPQLVQYTRVRHLTPPSKLPYNLKGNYDYSKDPFSLWVADFFKNKRGGVFIEAGAHKGEKESHTLYLEKELGWSGLLVECNPTIMPYLKTKHRKAWIADVCLSPSTHPKILNFSHPVQWDFSGTLKKPWKIPGRYITWRFFDVRAIPFYTILAALGLKEVDYFSFDIEGQELSVLKNFPFELVTFKVIVIEIQFYTDQEKAELDSLLKSKGYVFVRSGEYDIFYVHKNFSMNLSMKSSNK